MANDDDWTIMVGWRKAAVQTPIRLAAGLSLCWGGFWVLFALIGWLESQVGSQITLVGSGMILLIGIVFGRLASLAISRRLSDSTGLNGRHLLWPVCGLFAVGMLALHHYTVSILPQWEQISFWMSGVSGFVAIAFSIRQLLLDS